MRLILFILIITAAITSISAEDQKHLFILSGQSNMANMNPNASFTPMVEKKFGKENTIVVKDAAGGRPIRLWDKNYSYPKNHKKSGNSKGIGELYDRLMGKVKEAVGDEKYDTVTFCWMQGERDAKEGLSESYEAAFKSILVQLKKDLNVEKIYFVIGRISDYDMQNTKSKDWTKIRDIQVKLAEDDENGQWINCDDCNDGINGKKKLNNDLHMTKEGYRKMGKRFAEKAIALIQKKTIITKE